MPSANLTIARALQWARDYTDDAHERHWRRCIFQGIESDPLDQLLLMMLGGTMRSPLAKGCDAWSNAKGCACSVPLRMLGPSRTFVEIGANDGLHMANSWFFEAHLGWRGMRVEANPHVYQKLTSNRPRCINVNAVTAGKQPKSVPFVSFYRPSSGERAGAKEWETGLSGLEGFGGAHKSSLARAKMFAATRRPPLYVERSLLPTRSFADLFAEHGFPTIDVLMVDVEGAEYEVISSIDFQRVVVKLIVAETVNERLSELLRQQGFRQLGLTVGTTSLGDKLFVNERFSLHLM